MPLAAGTHLGPYEITEQIVNAAGTGDAAAAQIDVVLNWFDELKRLMSAK